jgi:choline dehydrogenase-like flavoprotein
MTTSSPPHGYVMLPPPPADGFEEVGTGRTLNADAVIVGSGPGGAAAARVLTQAGMKVVVVEAGPKQSRFQRNYAHTAKYHMQENGSIVAQGSAMMPIAAGKGVGGSTLINAALSFKAPDDVLKRWEESLQDPYWGPKELGPVFDEIAKYIGVGETPESVAGENNKLLVRGIKAMGFNGGLAPRSTPRCVGCGICYYGCPSSGKNSVNLNFLPEAVIAGGTIQAEVQVEEVIIEGGKAVGIRGVAIHPDTKERGGALEVRADRVILSAGAIGTPRLLWQCGVAKEMGPVGEHLHVHPGSTLIGISETKIQMWKGATQGAYFHPEELPGVLPHTFSAPPEACLVAGGFIGQDFQKGLALLPYMCGMLTMVSDKGNGRVRASRTGRADIKYNFHDDDVERIKLGLIEVAKVLLSGGARDLRAPIHGIGVVNSVEALRKGLDRCSIEDFSLYAAHPMGTCRMGLNPEQSVIGPDGESHSISGLFIADASVFPSSLGVNPQLSTMVVSTQIAHRILKRG